MIFKFDFHSRFDFDSSYGIREKGTGVSKWNHGTRKRMECRICLEGPSENREQNPLISPCLCRGTARLVHVACLFQWIHQNLETNAVCSVCGCAYHVPVGLHAPYVAGSLALMEDSERAARLRMQRVHACRLAAMLGYGWAGVLSGMMVPYVYSCEKDMSGVAMISLVHVGVEIVFIVVMWSGYFLALQGHWRDTSFLRCVALVAGQSILRSLGVLSLVGKTWHTLGAAGLYLSTVSCGVAWTWFAMWHVFQKMKIPYLREEEVSNDRL
jgi:hypothetical protein